MLLFKNIKFKSIYFTYNKTNAYNKTKNNNLLYVEICINYNIGVDPVI